MAKAKSPTSASDQENLDISLDTPISSTEENNFILPEIDIQDNISEQTAVEIPEIDMSSEITDTDNSQPQIAEIDMSDIDETTEKAAEIDMSDIDETTEKAAEIPSLEMDFPETTTESIPEIQPITQDIQTEEIIPQDIIEPEQIIPQPTETIVEQTQTQDSTLPDVNLPTHQEIPQQEESALPKLNKDFFINLGPTKEEQKQSEEKINIKTIKIDIGAEKISDEEKDKSLQDTISALNKDEGKIDEKNNPMINVLSEISKTGLSLDETIAHNVESEIFKNVIKRNKLQKIFKVLMIIISMVGLFGTGSYFVYENKEDVMASILNISKGKININTSNKPAQNNVPQDNKGNTQPNNNMTPPIPNTNNEELEKIKKEHLQINDQLKTLQGQLGSKDQEIKKLNEKITAFNNTGDIVQNFLNTTYKDDYRFIRSMKIDEGQKNNYLIDINMLMMDLKNKKTSFSDFRIKYNNLINKILLAHPDK